MLLLIAPAIRIATEQQLRPVHLGFRLRTSKLDPSCTINQAQKVFRPYFVQPCMPPVISVSDCHAVMPPCKSHGRCANEAER